jgi:hypothetical protein
MGIEVHFMIFLSPVALCYQTLAGIGKKIHDGVLIRLSNIDRNAF